MSVKAILIDPFKRELSYIDISSTTDICKHIHCDLICSGGQFRNGDTLYVDDEGFLKDNTYFAIKLTQRVLAGRAVLMGREIHDTEPYCDDVKTPIEHIRELIQWSDPLPNTPRPQGQRT